MKLFIPLVFFTLSILPAMGDHLRPQLAAIGEPSELEIVSHDNVKLIYRILKSTGEKQIWNLEGENKHTWVTEAGKVIDSPNFEYSEPGTITIKKFSADDAGEYNYERLRPRKQLSHGAHYDPGFKGIDLQLPIRRD